MWGNWHLSQVPSLGIGGEPVLSLLQPGSWTEAFHKSLADLPLSKGITVSHPLPNNLYHNPLGVQSRNKQIQVTGEELQTQRGPGRYL